MTSAALSTQFAPAERASIEQVHRQYERFSGTPLVGEIVDTIPEIFIILNAERQIVFFNQALIDFLNKGNEESDLLGLRPGEAFHCIHADETEGGCGTTEFCQECGAVHAILTSQKGKKDVRECRISNKMNSEVEALDLRVFTSPFNFNNERFSIFAITDISHEKRRRALERIFFHDILNTVYGLSGFADFLQEESPEELEDSVSTIIMLSNRLIEEIVAQKELIAAENNELHITPQSISSKELLQELASSYDHHEVARKRLIRVDAHTEDVMFSSDSRLLRRVLGNMLKNALEASPPGEIVTIGCELLNSTIQFWVHNTNFMFRNIQLQVFQRSFSTKGKDRGLGTYSMKLLTERYLKGGISFTTSPEEGTIFKAWFPIILPS